MRLLVTVLLAYGLAFLHPMAVRGVGAEFADFIALAGVFGWGVAAIAASYSDTRRPSVLGGIAWMMSLALLCGYLQLNLEFHSQLFASPVLGPFAAALLYLLVPAATPLAALIPGGRTDDV